MGKGLRPSAVIETTGLSKSYGRVKAVRSLNLSVPRNSIFAFLGPNGAGKSTTIKMLLGLTYPTDGSGQIFGLDIEKDSVRIRKRVGYLAQEPHFYPGMTVRQTLQFVARFFYTGPRRAIERRIDETLDLVGLTELQDRMVSALSGGERQRLGIAQAQINYPDLLILDEPAASLDPMGRRDVLAVMERLRKHTTILYSTHILSDVQRVSDMVAIMNKGELVAQAPIDELLSGSGSGAYEMTLRGDLPTVYGLVRDLPFVKAVQRKPLAETLNAGSVAASAAAAEPHGDSQLISGAKLSGRTALQGDSGLPGASQPSGDAGLLGDATSFSDAAPSGISAQNTQEPAGPAESWTVSVSDEAAAERYLLRVVLRVDGVTVTRFVKKHRDLEEVFVGLVEGGDSR